MSENIIGIYGAGGFGREVMSLVLDQLEPGGLEAQSRFLFIDDVKNGTSINGHEVLAYQDFLGMEGSKSVVVAVGDSKLRQRLAARCEEDGLAFLGIRAANSVVQESVELGGGAILCSFSCITANAQIGEFFHLNFHSYVAHDCRIGDYVTFAPSVVCSGNVHIEDYVYIGAGAVIKQGTPGRPLRIGRGAVVGMGAVVTKDVPAGAVVVGNPAKLLIKS